MSAAARKRGRGKPAADEPDSDNNTGKTPSKAAVGGKSRPAPKRATGTGGRSQTGTAAPPVPRIDHAADPIMLGCRPHLQRLVAVERILTHGTASAVVARGLPVWVPLDAPGECGAVLQPVTNLASAHLRPSDTVFFVKWRRLSYAHASWVPGSVIECSDPHARRLALASHHSVGNDLVTTCIAVTVQRVGAAGNGGGGSNSSEDSDGEGGSVGIDDGAADVWERVDPLHTLTESDADRAAVDAELAALRRRGSAMLRAYLNSDRADTPVRPPPLLLNNVCLFVCVECVEGPCARSPHRVRTCVPSTPRQLWLEVWTEHVQAERVVASRDVTVYGGTGVGGLLRSVLIKWAGLPYSECSWEWEHDADVIQLQVSTSRVRCLRFEISVCVCSLTVRTRSHAPSRCTISFRNRCHRCSTLT